MEIATLCISLLSFFAALAAVIVPIIIYKKQRKYDEEAEQRSIERERQAEQRRIKNELQDLQDELTSLNSHSPFPMSENERVIYSRGVYLNKRVERLKRK